MLMCLIWPRRLARCVFCLLEAVFFFSVNVLPWIKLLRLGLASRSTGPLFMSVCVCVCACVCVFVLRGVKSCWWRANPQDVSGIFFFFCVTASSKECEGWTFFSLKIKIKHVIIFIRLWTLSMNFRIPKMCNTLYVWLEGIVIRCMIFFLKLIQALTMRYFRFARHMYGR